MKTTNLTSEVMPAGKKLPMDKDPRFLAILRKEIIDGHNKKFIAKQKKG